MSKTLQAMLFPFLSMKFHFGDGDTAAAAPAAQPEATQENVATGTEATAATETDETKPEKTFSQAELNDIVEKRLAKERRRLQREASLEAENRALKAQVDGQQRPAQQAEDPDKPKPEQFKTYEEYLDKLSDWKLDQREKAAVAQREAETAKSTQQTVQKRWTENSQKAREKHADFDHVIDQDLEISRPMLDAILDSEIGPEVAYFLGKNPAEAQRIAGLSPTAAAREIGKIEAKLAPAAEPEKKPEPSKAPAPATPVKGGSVQTGPTDNDDMKTWLEKRNKQLRDKRKR